MVLTTASSSAKLLSVTMLLFLSQDIFVLLFELSFVILLSTLKLFCLFLFVKKYIPNKDIDSAEKIPDASTYLDINQFEYFNYGIDDIDKAQSMDGVMEALQEETIEQRKSFALFKLQL